MAKTAAPAPKPVKKAAPKVAKKAAPAAKPAKKAAPAPKVVKKPAPAPKVAAPKAVGHLEKFVNACLSDKTLAKLLAGIGASPKAKDLADAATKAKERMEKILVELGLPATKEAKAFIAKLDVHEFLKFSKHLAGGGDHVGT